MRAYFLLLLPLCRFYFLVHSAPINHKLVNLDGESAPVVTNERKQISNASKLTKADSEEWEKLVHKALNKYDMRFPPHSGRGPTVVRASVKVLGVPLFREQDFRMDLVLDMTEKWQDKRLSSNRSRVIQVPPHFATQIWQPNIAFEGTLSKTHGVIYFDESHHVHPNGTVVHKFQISLSTLCHFFRQDYPFDRRTCELTFGSASYSMHTVLYEWADKLHPVQFMADALASLTEWNFRYFRLYVDIKVSDDGTQFSKITLQLVAARKASHIIMSFLIPFFVLVILNWIPTCIIDNWAARIISGVGMLATTLGMIHQRPSGSIGYDTSLDYYWYIGFLVASSCLAHSGVVLCFRNKELSEAEDTQEGRVERRPGVKRVFKSLRQRILRRLPNLEQRKPHDIELEVDLEAAVPEQELSPAIRQDNVGSEQRSKKWDRAFHICSPIGAIIAVTGLTLFHMIQHPSGTIPDDSLIDTALAIFNSTQGLIRRSHYP